MAIHYRCRHCGFDVGKIEEHNLNSEQLGFHQLDSNERTEMIEYDDDGHMHVKTICEDCHEALDRNPQFHENQTFIQ
ncbi:peptide ABC transporter permease [Anaerobacillus arseniciselenatis]|uniref:Peptide ABC transporter permease n=1 Tax=Anaerobacillus arseniciselenatis TaxID=85682 RepID=A0A1S2LPM5_9BACI|nr:anti-sigma-F factor Fin family protein [Anaerobacillus arseniciselenatis]OIJ14462.1 peptide ABC transporter permease [Anaerobacillus arseniciselenatis]